MPDVVLDLVMRDSFPRIKLLKDCIDLAADIELRHDVFNGDVFRQAAGLVRSARANSSVLQGIRGARRRA